MREPVVSIGSSGFRRAQQSRRYSWEISTEIGEGPASSWKIFEKR